MKERLTKNLGFLFILLFFSATSQAAEKLKSAVIGKPPFAWEENGKRQGFHYDIADAIATRSGSASDIQMAPVMRIIELLRAGAVDFIILTNFKELEEMKTKKTLLLEVPFSLFSLNSRPIKSILDAKDGTIARLGRGCTALNDQTGFQWLDIQSYEQALDLLKAGRVRGVCSTIAFWHVVAKKGFKREIADFPFSKTTVWVHVLPAMEDAKFKKIQKAVNSLINDGTVEKLKNRYLESPLQN